MRKTHVVELRSITEVRVQDLRGDLQGAAR